MKEYFDNQHSDPVVVGFEMLPMPNSDCPISPASPQWEIVSDPNRYMKSFEFNDFESFNLFLSEVLVYQEQIQHHGKITIDQYNVIIEIYTHDVNDVTEIDQEYVHMIDNIFQDVEYSVGTKENDYV